MTVLSDGKRARRRSILAGAYGNAIEWYDFALYGYFAPVIAKLFFPEADAVASFLATFGVFAVGFVVRPLGGALFGVMADRLGRRRALLASVILMALPTCAMGLLPSYQTAGELAPLLLVLVRLLQGLAVGGEFTGSISYLVEFAPPKRRGLFGSWSMCSCFTGILLGSATAALMTSLLAPEALQAWGWRLPFLAGALLGLLGFLLRRGMAESPAFQEAAAEGTLTEHPIRQVFAQEKKHLFLVIGLLWVNAVCQYYLFTFFTTYIHHYGGLSLAQTLQINSLCMAVITLCLPLFGALSDRVGRRPVLIAGSLGFLLLTWPLLAMMTSGHYAEILIAQLVFALFVAARSGPIPATLVEAFPTRVRATALSLGYNINFAIFGGTAPMIATWLIDATGKTLAPAWYLMPVALVSIVVSLVMRPQWEEASGR